MKASEGVYTFMIFSLIFRLLSSVLLVTQALTITAMVMIPNPSPILAAILSLMVITDLIPNKSKLN
jgi:hypothetical protein